MMRSLKRILEAAIAWGFYYLLKILPVDVASGMMGKLARLVGLWIPVSRVAWINLGIALPHKTGAEKKEIIKGCWENLGRVVGEFPHLSSIANADSRVSITGLEHLETIKNSGKSSILFSGHLANWEIIGAMAHRLGLPVSLVYRHANNPLTDALYHHARRNIAAKFYPKNREGARMILQGIKRGETFGMLVDQKMNDGMEVPFFGKPAMTAKAIADFAIRQNIPIYPVRIQRLQGVHFAMEILPPLAPEADALTLLTSINKIVEEWIIANPSQWFWLHRRWPKPLYTLSKKHGEIFL